MGGFESSLDCFPSSTHSIFLQMIIRTVLDVFCSFVKTLRLKLPSYLHLFKKMYRSVPTVIAHKGQSVYTGQIGSATVHVLNYYF